MTGTVMSRIAGLELGFEGRMGSAVGVGSRPLGFCTSCCYAVDMLRDSMREGSTNVENEASTAVSLCTPSSAGY